MREFDYITQTHDHEEDSHRGKFRFGAANTPARSVGPHGLPSTSSTRITNEGYRQGEANNKGHSPDTHGIVPRQRHINNEGKNVYRRVKRHGATQTSGRAIRSIKDNRKYATAAGTVHRGERPTHSPLARWPPALT